MDRTDRQGVKKLKSGSNYLKLSVKCKILKKKRRNGEIQTKAVWYLSGKASEGGYSVAGMENVYFSNPQANFGTEVHEIEHDSY